MVILLPHANAGDHPVYPQTRTVEQVHQYGPVQLADPFVWLEEKNEETEAWFRDQDQVTRGFIS